MFTDLSQALAIARNNLGIVGVATARDTELTALLIASAGKDNLNTLNYRPYLVAAYFLPLWGAVDRSLLISADGVTWLKPNDLTPLITSLLTLQESADCGLSIDVCWCVYNLRVKLTCGCEEQKYIGMMGATVL